MLKQSRSSLLLASALTCFWLFSRPLSFAAEPGIVLSGTYEYVARPEQSPPFFIAHYNFEMRLSDYCWILNYEDAAASTNSDLAKVKGTASFDGTNIYVVRFQGEGLQKAAWERHKSVKNTLPAANADIFPGNYPPPDPFVVQKIWFAFASGGVFKSTEGKAKPPSDVDLAIFYSTNFEYNYFWTTNLGEPVSWQIDIVNENGRLLTRDRKTGRVKNFTPPGFSKGYTNSVGLWRQITNINGIAVAKDFEYTEFAPQVSRVDKSSLEKVLKCKCIVTNVALSEIGSVPAKLVNGRVHVTDRRFAAEGYADVAYISTNGWIAVNDKSLTDQLIGRPKISLEQQVESTINVPPRHSDSIR